MTLQRRLLLLLLVAVPVVWAAAVAVAVVRARHEINELFDTQQIRLAQQVMTLLPRTQGPPPIGEPAPEAAGAAELEDLGVAVWRGAGVPYAADREGAALPYRDAGSGFVRLDIDGKPWIVYYLRATRGDWTVAVGQASDERDELLQNLLLGQFLSWALLLPVLVIALALVVRHGLRPIHLLAHDVEARGADDLRPVAKTGLPTELQPLVVSMNRLFERIRVALEKERRFTADAAHELRTPLAALRAQWEAARLQGQAAGDTEASRRIGEGIERLARIVNQLLSLSGADARDPTSFTSAVDWPSVVGNALTDCLPLVSARDADVAIEWPVDGSAPLAMVGDDALLTVMVRNLVDNAVRYAPPGVEVRIVFHADGFFVEDNGPGLSQDARDRLGQRFYRSAGLAESGSGLGFSIVQKIAELHRLGVTVGARADHRPGTRVSIGRLAA